MTEGSMKKVVFISLILGLVSVGLMWTFKASAQSGNKKSGTKQVAWKEVSIGMVPTEFGELVGFTGTIGNYAMMFKAQEGDLRILEFRGNRINPKALVLKRKY